MVSEEKAIRWIDGMDAYNVRSFTIKRLNGQDTTPIESSYASEPSEEVIITLLKAADLPVVTREGLIVGLEEVYTRIIGRIIVLPTSTSHENFLNLVVRICRVVDIVSPPEMKEHAYSLLYLSKNRNVNPIIRSAAIRAAVGYPQTKSDAGLWESFLEFPECAAYVFNTLLKINPESLHIEKYLTTLFYHRFRDEWPIDVMSILRRAIRIRSSNKIAINLLEYFRNNQQLWKLITIELNRHPWSKEWLEEKE